MTLGGHLIYPSNLQRTAYPSSYMLAASYALRQSPVGSDVPQERLSALGVRSLSNAELLSLLLECEPDATSQTAAFAQAQQVLADWHSLSGLAKLSFGELSTLVGLNSRQAARIMAASEFGRRVARESLAKVTVDSPEIVYQLMATRYQGLNQESVQVLLLDTKRQLLRIEEVHRGSLRESVAHPREIFRPAVIYSADSIIVTHNHPSGHPAPSEHDNELTRQILAAGRTLGIEVADHIIIGAPLAGTPLFYSYRQEEKL